MFLARKTYEHRSAFNHYRIFVVFVMTNWLVSIQYCDGSVFPGRGPNAFPCNRNAVCVECRKTATYRQSDTWFCLECLETPTTFEGIYGNQICPPRDDPLCKDVTRVLPAVKGKPRSRVLVYVRPLGAPVLEKGTHHNPSQDYDDFVATNDAKQNVGWVAERKKEASSRLLDMFAEAALSSGQQAVITRGLRKMQKDKIVHTLNDVQIFGQPKTLLRWAERLGDGAGFGALPTTYFLDSSALLPSRAFSRFPCH
jgi:hypothetical protein